MKSLRNVPAPGVSVRAPDEKKSFITPPASTVGKACWGISSVFLALGVAGLVTGSAVTAANCSFTVGEPDQSSDACFRGFVLTGISLFAMTAAWCGCAATNHIKRREAHELRLQNLPKMAANPATHFAKSAAVPQSVLTEIKVENVVTAKAPGVN